MVDILDMPFGNVFAVQCAFARLGVGTRTVRNAEDVERASALVIPGVGAFGATMDWLRGNGLDGILRQRGAERRATLGICLGMQIFFAESEETPDVPGLDVLPGRLVGVPTPVIPHFGWAEVASSRDPAPQWAFFSHSFALIDREDADDGFEVTRCRAEAGFVAALDSGPFALCQFHPELSGRFGSQYLRDWLVRATGGAQ